MHVVVDVASTLGVLTFISSLGDSLAVKDFLEETAVIRTRAVKNNTQYFFIFI